MNPLLFIPLQASEMTRGAMRMAQTDPHGWTLTLIAVTVVFSALVILFCIFTIVGKVSIKMEERSSQAGATKPEASRKGRAVKAGKGAPDAEVAAAIALALEAEQGGEVPVAIATALSLYLGNSIHDEEPFVITINRAPSAWDSPALRFRKNPVK